MATRGAGTSAERSKTGNPENTSGPQIEPGSHSDDLHIHIQTNRFNESGWGNAKLIETGNGDVFWPQIAFDNNGSALAVWVQKDGVHTNIRANRFNGSAWGTAELIEADNGDAFWPQIALDNNGNALVVWAQDDGSRTNIMANRFNGSAWGTAELIETDNAGDALWPQIAVDDSGNAIAVWVQKNGTRYNIQANRFDGSAWGIAELIETDDAGNALWPQIAFDNNGNALAVWTQDDGSRTNIMANRFGGSGWESAGLIETDNAGDALWPQIAFDSSGKAIAVWAQSDGARYNIRANRFNGVTWGTVERVETDNTRDAFGPQIAVDNNGNALVLWGQYDGSRTNIRANRFNGADWGIAGLIETNNAGNAFGPQVTFDISGNAFAVWVQNDGTRYNIQANRFDGSAWGNAELIEADNAGDAFRPQIALDNNGNAIAVWEQHDGARENIRVNRFE